MRYQMTLKLRIADKPEEHDTQESFWTEYIAHNRGELTTIDPRNIELVENRTKYIFPRILSSNLSAIIGPSIISVTSLTYGSISLGLSVLTGALSSLGITSDDLIDLLEQYAPDAFSHAAGYGPVPLIASAQGKQVAQSDSSVVQIPNGQQESASRLGKIWSLSNLSLVVPSLLLVAVAYALFISSESKTEIILKANTDNQSKLIQSVADDRNALTKTVAQERLELSTEREKILERLEVELQALLNQKTSDIKTNPDSDLKAVPSSLSKKSN